MTWTTDTPTHPGYYWLRENDTDAKPCIMIVEPVSDIDCRLESTCCGSDYYRMVDTITGEWLGPVLPPPAPCTWTEDADDGSFDTGCGNKHTFIDGTPRENEYRFCPYCGGALQETTVESETFPVLLHGGPFDLRGAIATCEGLPVVGRTMDITRYFPDNISVRQVRGLYRLTKVERDGETVRAEGEYILESGFEKIWPRATEAEADADAK